MTCSVFDHARWQSGLSAWYVRAYIDRWRCSAVGWCADLTGGAGRRMYSNSA